MMKSYIAGTWAGVSDSVKSAFARLRENRRLCWMIGLMGKYLLCGLALLAWTIAAARYGQREALEIYRVWMADYEAAQAAAAQEAIETDPYTIQLKAEATLAAKALAGIKDFHYDTESKEAVIQCMWNRVENGAFPDTLEQVLLQDGAFEFFDESNKMLEEDYQLAYRYLDKLHSSETLLCDPDFAFLELGRDRVTLRDTLYKTSQTNYWRR